jgi:hypothetical protein
MRATVALAKPCSWIAAIAAVTSCFRLMGLIPSLGISLPRKQAKFLLDGCPTKILTAAKRTAVVSHHTVGVLAQVFSRQMREK